MTIGEIVRNSASKFSGFLVTGAALVAGGEYMMRSNPAPLPGEDQSAQAYINLRRDMTGNDEVSVQDVLENPIKYAALNRLYNEMTDDPKLMSKVEAEESRRTSNFNGFGLRLFGSIPLVLGLLAVVGESSAEFCNRRREEDE